MYDIRKVQVDCNLMKRWRRRDLLSDISDKEESSVIR
jgi:hypothetical protein